MDVSRAGPFGRIPPAAQHVLPLDQVNPVVRIAHRTGHPLNIAERIIVDHEFVLITAGQGVLVRPDGPTPFRAGTLLFIRPFEPHAFQSTGVRGGHLAVHFDFRANVPPRGRDLSKRVPYAVRLTGGIDLPPVFRCGLRGAIAQAMASIVDAGPIGAPLSNLARRAHLLSLLSQLVDRASATRADDTTSDALNLARLDRAIATMSARLAQPWNAAQLATVAGMSLSHFTRRFRHHTGQSPMAYLRHRRVDAARLLLADVDLSIKEIAHRCGFDDPYHFSKVFHQIDGLSPSVYRETLMAGRVDGP